MTDLISLIFWSFLGLLALASLVAMIRMGYKPRETGPWVVTRVGVGGREFYEGTTAGFPFWGSLVNLAIHFTDHKEALGISDRLLADVHPLSRYIGGVR